MLLFILWMLLPLALIPLSIILGCKISKLNTFVRELLAGGRITGSEYQNLKADSAPNPVAGTYPAPGTVPTPVPAPYTAPKPAPVSYAVPNPAPVSYAVPNPAPVSYAVPNPAPQKRASSASVLFAIGVTFVILAGFIFSTAIWVYLSNIARTGVIAGAALLFFLISALAQKQFGLKNTSIAFYLLGAVFSAIAFFTAGAFWLFGAWFALWGGGRFLFVASSALVIMLFSVLAIRLYKKNIYIYFALYSALFALTFVFLQCCGSYAAFALLISVFAAMCSAACYLARIKTKEPIAPYFRHAVLTVRILYGCIALPLLLIQCTDWSAYSWLICALCIAELSFYGLKRNSRLLFSFQSVFVLALCLELCRVLSDVSDADIARFVLLILLLALAALYRYFRQIYTVCADILFLLAAFIDGLLLLYTALLPFGLIGVLALELFFLAAALDHTRALRGFFRIFLPLPLLLLLLEFAGDVFSFDTAQSFALCGALFAALALACALPAKKDKRFVPIKYSLELFSGATLLVLSIAAFTPSMLALSALLCILALAEFHTSGKNIHALLPLYALFLALGGMLTSDLTALGYASMTMSLLTCAVMLAASRGFFGRGIHIAENGKSRWDVFSVGILLCPFLLNRSCTILGHSALAFLVLAELAVFSANLCRKQSGKNFRCAALTVSAAFAALALMTRPFLVPDSRMIASKITLLLLLAFGFVFRRIWREKPRLARGFFAGLTLAAYLLLLLDGLVFRSLPNTLFVLCVSLAILIASFVLRKKRWFIASAAGLLGLTLYAMRDFLARIDWWVYLLLAGILLILIAAVNEYRKNHGTKEDGKAGSLFENWK